MRDPGEEETSWRKLRDEFRRRGVIRAAIVYALIGWGDRTWMLNDSDLTPLHAHPRFKALLARID
jgi:hypothetical protein